MPSRQGDRRQSPPTRPKVNIRDLGPGCIVWLPEKPETTNSQIQCIRENCCLNRELDDGGYDHPVLIIELKQDSMCSFAQVTSRPSKKRRDERLAIWSPACEGSSKPALYLETGVMDRQSYVRIEHIFDVHVGQLRTLGFQPQSTPCDRRLTRQSYEYILKRLKLEVDKPWIFTELLNTAGSCSTEPGIAVQQRSLHNVQGQKIATPSKKKSHAARLMAWEQRVRPATSPTISGELSGFPATLPHAHTQTPLLPTSYSSIRYHAAFTESPRRSSRRVVRGGRLGTTSKTAPSPATLYFWSLGILISIMIVLNIVFGWV